MSINAVKKINYKGIAQGGIQPYFEVRVIRLDTYCVANEDDVSQFYKIYFIEDGSGEYEIDFQSVKINGSGIFCLSPGQVFTVQSEQIRSGYQIIFDREFYCVETHGKAIACNGVLFHNVHRAAMIPVDKEGALFGELIEQMIGELKQPGPAHRALLETYLRQFLIHALRIWDQNQPALSNDIDSGNLASEFIALVEKHYAKVHTVSDYADKLFVSPKSLAKGLNRLGYPTPGEIIRNRITLQAKRELRFSNKSVKEIAYDLGYDDPAYFSRLFSKEVGQSPIQYRNSSRLGNKN